MNFSTMSIGKKRTGLVIVAAGRGERAGQGHGPKQYRPLNGRAVIAHTLDCFAAFVEPDDTVIVIHADDHALLDEAIGMDRRANLHVVTGGASRQASVHAGLEALAALADPPASVMIHDAARPFVSGALIGTTMDTADALPAPFGILPVLPLSETIKRVDAAGQITATVDRTGLARAQTPQTFDLTGILAAHRRAAMQSDATDFTDDASLYEWLGHPVHAIAGESANVKLTWPADFEDARARAPKEKTAMMLPDVRTGNGYDVHRFGPGDHVMLCGVAIPHDRALSGHSDADVGLHALTDALLATCGGGDIGDHFPPSDPQWKGAASFIFLEHAAKLVRAAGGTIMNADVTLIAEAPKIAPFRANMCQRLGSILGIEPSRCSVKATTNEKMGFAGRKEGIAAIATASVVYGMIHHEPSHRPSAHDT